MRRVRVIPVIMIDSGRAVITRKFSNPVYVGDPINSIRILNEKEVDELVILDISSKRKASSPNFDLIEKMASESFMPLAYGGHVTSINEAERLIKSGVEKIVFNSALFSHPKTIKELSYRIGKQSIVASIDVHKNWLGKYRVVTQNNSKRINQELEDVLQHVCSLGVGEVFLNNIDRDGSMSGYDVSLLQRASSVLNVPLIACGGASSIQDFKLAITEGKASAVAAGAMFFFKGSFNAVLLNYPDQQTLTQKLYSNLQ